MFHPEPSKDLAIREIWISLHALLRSLICLIEDIENVKVPRRKFRAINTAEKATCLVEGRHKGTADISSSILGLESFVLPAFNLNYRH